MRYSEIMNEAQKEAISLIDGPLLVLAGAGAGKTRVIAHRVFEIVKKYGHPEQILAITFTNKAAGEMRERIESLLQAPSNSRFMPFVSTFHSLGLTIIKENYSLLGYTRKPGIYDRADSLRTLKESLRSLRIESLEPRAALSYISKQKGEGATAEAYGESAGTPQEIITASVWQAYEEALHKATALDFDDLLCGAVRVLDENPSVRRSYQERWKYLHIDEYQDTNAIQAKITHLLMGPEQNICAVGDIDQTIYSWRGAKIANILSFEKNFPSAKVILLEENYRSTKIILAAANDIIAKNIFRREKNLYTKNSDGEQLVLYQAFDEGDEARFITKTVQELLRSRAQPRDCAVLYRANFQSRAIEEEFLNCAIPYQVIGTRFFERREIKDVLSYIRAALYNSPADFARVANVPARGIGKITLTKILSGREQDLQKKIQEKVSAFRTLLLRIKETSVQLPPSQVVQFVVQKSGMEKLFLSDKIDGMERLENVRELISLATRYDHAGTEGLELFLESAALATDQDEIKDDANAVRLMTIHASKGLEFPYVFISGLEEGLFPYDKEGETEVDKEEERRLMYVALTRAKERVFLSYASYRTIFGLKNATVPSQFIFDISEELIEVHSPSSEFTIYLD